MTRLMIRVMVVTICLSLEQQAGAEATRPVYSFATFNLAGSHTFAIGNARLAMNRMGYTEVEMKNHHMVMGYNKAVIVQVAVAELDASKQYVMVSAFSSDRATAEKAQADVAKIIKTAKRID